MELLEELRINTKTDFISSLKEIESDRLVKALTEINVDDHTLIQWQDAYHFFTEERTSSHNKQEIHMNLVSNLMRREVI